MVIYACWRELSNLPARGTLIACSGSGDCGGQMQGETCGGLVAEGRVGPRGVVVGDPGGDRVAGMGEVRNSVSLRNSSRIRPLKLSTNPFCIGFPGAM